MSPREKAIVWVHRGLVVAAAMVALATALRTRPTPYGDAPEYYLMAESLANHGSPDRRAEDIDSLARLYLRAGLSTPPTIGLIGYYEADDGGSYSYHFWAYALVCLPAKFLLRIVGADELKALPLTNAFLMAVALLAVALSAPFPERQRLVLNALLFLSPACWFILWPHPEVYSFSLVALSLLALWRHQRKTAILWAALAALQNVQLGILVVFLWLKAALRVRGRCHGGLALRVSARWRDLLIHALPALPLLIYPLFFYAHFGTFSVVAREATSIEKLSLSRALDLLFDLNLGLLPYIPLALLVYLATVARSLVKRDPGLTAQLFLVFAAILVANTLQWNFNHGTSGPSRYVIWMLPLIFVPLAAEATSRAAVLTLAMAIAVQGGILLSRGGLIPRYDYLDHSPLAAWVLDHAPALYHPDYEVFIKRTLHAEGRPTHGPYVYWRDGRCRKVLANRTHEDEVRGLCGDVPEKYVAFFRAEVVRKSERKAWRYLDY